MTGLITETYMKRLHQTSNVRSFTQRKEGGRGLIVVEGKYLRDITRSALGHTHRHADIMFNFITYDVKLFKT